MTWLGASYDTRQVVARPGMAWHGVAWHGMEWSGMAWHDMVEEEIWRKERENGRVVNEPFEIRRAVDHVEWWVWG
eukprot:360020-Chlamydomonas_euryale.AAC.7